MSADSPALPRREAAALLGVHPDTLDKWADEGRFRNVYRYGEHGQRRYDRDELIAYKEASRIRQPVRTAPAVAAIGSYTIAPLPDHNFPI